MTILETPAYIVYNDFFNNPTKVMVNSKEELDLVIEDVTAFNNSWDLFYSADQAFRELLRRSRI